MMRKWKRPRVVLLLVTVAIFAGVAWWRDHSEPKEATLSITDGARVRLECAGVSVQPEPGWGVTSFDGRADGGKPQVCSPRMTRLAASITTLLMPKDGAPLRAQAEAFVAKLILDEVSYRELTAPSGLKLVHVTGSSTRHADGGAAAAIRMDAFFFVNAQGRMAVIYELAMPDAAERFVSWFVQTVRMDP